MRAETTYSAIVGRVIAVRRKKMALNQENVAEKAGINRSSLSRIENGDVAPDIFQLTHIARALSCSLEEIVKEADKKRLLLEGMGVIVHMRLIRYEQSRPVAPFEAEPLAPLPQYAAQDEEVTVLFNADQGEGEWNQQETPFEQVQPVALLDAAALEGLMYDDHIGKKKDAGEM